MGGAGWVEWGRLGQDRAIGGGLRGYGRVGVGKWGRAG